MTALADDGLRVRSEPRVSDDSDMYEPLLPAGTDLYVLDGPVSASGYDWYEVAPLARDLPTMGWVASAGHDGEPWIAAGDFDCPPLPTDFRALAALPPGVGLACFPRVPITVEARWVALDCHVDPPLGWFEPRWFNGLEALVEPAQTEGTGCDSFRLNMDPNGDHPLREPWGHVIEVTGIFDHPAASECTWTGWDPVRQVAHAPITSQGCRLAFAVTRLLVSDQIPVPPKPTGVTFDEQARVSDDEAVAEITQTVTWQAPRDQGVEIRVYGVTECVAEPANPSPDTSGPCLVEHTPLPASVRTLLATAPASDGVVSWSWTEDTGCNPGLAYDPDGPAYYSVVLAAFSSSGHSIFAIAEPGGWWQPAPGDVVC